MSDKPLSSPDIEPQLLLDSGPMMLRDFNPRGVLRFQGRKCETCGNEIMDHWLRTSVSLDADIRGTWWCDKDGRQASTGMKI